MANHTPLTDQQLAELDELIARTTPVGAVTASPGLLGMLIAEIRRLRAQVAAVHGLCDEQDKAARAFEASTPAWVRAVRAVVQSADVDQMATALRREGFSTDQVTTMLSPHVEADGA